METGILAALSARLEADVVVVCAFRNDAGVVSGRASDDHGQRFYLKAPGNNDRRSIKQV